MAGLVSGEDNDSMRSAGEGGGRERLSFDDSDPALLDTLERLVSDGPRFVRLVVRFSRALVTYGALFSVGRLFQTFVICLILSPQLGCSTFKEA